ncbi:Multidrug resistance-associated protein 4 [Armadillidium vulgare]|nr:Multidrug resistance-associated protein 4 [Armadillidium vulgare]
MNEMTSAMRVIKMYAWEWPFRKVIEQARRLEIDVILKSNYYRAVNLTLFFTSSKIILFISFLAYVLSGNILTAEKVFLTTSLINNIRLSMTLFFSFGVSMGSETLISCKRIQKFLEMEEKEDSDRVTRSDLRPKPQNCYVEGYDICARWDPRSGEDTLSKVSFSVKAGQVVAVIGPVGAGKSSLLQAILSELPLKDGQINIRGKISYASQEPWLFNGTVKDNILFGQPYHAKRYSEIIKVCALERDMELFPEGDMTQVGERGVALSGGQKARINLARAVYFDADIYLLDDPLSAVDAHVGNHLFEECIQNYLMGKAVLLATHQVQFLSKTDHILLLNGNGYLAHSGTYSQLLTKGIDFAGIVATEEDFNANLQGQDEKAKGQEKDDNLVCKTTRMRRLISILQGIEEVDEGETMDSQSIIAVSAIGGSIASFDDYFDYEDEENDKDGRKEYGAEKKLTGSIGLKVYIKYFVAGGGVIGTFFLFAFNVGSQTNAEQLNGEYLDLQEQNNTFGNWSPLSNKTVFELSDADRASYVNVYAGMTVALLVCVLIRAILFFKICMTASKNLHNSMFAAVVMVPLVFFEVHPIGQILNRFTKDTGQVDDLLPPAMYDFITISFMFLGILAVILYLNIWLIIAVAILGVVLVFVRWIYICSARDIKRLEGITRSPVFSHLSSTFQGLPTIRAFQAQQQLSFQFDGHQDLHTSCWYLFVCSSRLFGVWLDFLSLILIAFVTFSFFFDDTALGGDVGLGVSMVMLLSGMLQWGVRQSAEVENHMTSVERILEYSKLEPEVPPDANLKPKKDDWPSKGRVTFKSVYLYYDQDSPPVLKNLNFTIEPREKIGIVGRTGAGKSSLLSCLFRLTPPQGEIIIDEVDTENLLREDLRRSISIIPQDPTLFTGTVRYNLDPFSLYTDEQIWNALEEVQLKEHVKDMNGCLEAQITEGGGNLSVGQRQTDGWIQETIREKFADCTVLTIAHRLHTIMDSDRVMVMDSGKLMEFEVPHHLLENPESIFSDLVDQTGPTTSLQLRKIARESHVEKQAKLLSSSTPPKLLITQPTLLSLSDDISSNTKPTSEYSTKRPATKENIEQTLVGNIKEEPHSSRSSSPSSSNSEEKEPESKEDEIVKLTVPSTPNINDGTDNSEPTSHSSSDESPNEENKILELVTHDHKNSNSESKTTEELNSQLSSSLSSDDDESKKSEIDSVRKPVTENKENSGTHFLSDKTELTELSELNMKKHLATNSPEKHINSPNGDLSISSEFQDGQLEEGEWTRL